MEKHHKKDLFPSLEELLLKPNEDDDITNITITLSSSSIEFFKHEAKKHHTQYQKLIRIFLDEYVARYDQ